MIALFIAIIKLVGPAAAGGGVSVFGLGMPELIIIVVVALLIFGPKKLPQLGQGIGEAISGFKKAVRDEDRKPTV